DSSAHGRHGTYAGSGITYSATSLLIGDSSTGITLNGSTGMVSLAPIDFPKNNEDWSIECWFKSSSLPSGLHVLAYFGQHRNQGYAALTLNGTTLSAVTGVAGIIDYAASTTVSTSTVYHAVGTYTAGTIKLYLNGSLVWTVGGIPARTIFPEMAAI